MTEEEPGDLAKAVARAIEWVRELDDPTIRAKAAQDAVNAAQQAVSDLGQLRREAMTAMLDAGLSRADIARALDLTPERVRQLMSSGPRPARTVLGAGKLTFNIGGKFEAEKDACVLSAEAFAAYEHLSGAARALGLDSVHEVVPPPGIVDLNQDNLIVIGSPRLLPFVSQVLAADPAYGWDRDDAGAWFLIDKIRDTVYRSPADSGESIDYAYVGRLPRPDGAGSFLYLAGIHAQGTLGAAHWLADNLDYVHSETRGKRWSTLVESHYTPQGEITTARRLVELVRHDAASTSR